MIETTPALSNQTAPLWENVPCNLCGSGEQKVKYHGTTDLDTAKLLASYSASGNFVSNETIVECRECGLVYTSPRLARDFILKGYTENADATYVSQARGRVKTFERCLSFIQRYKKTGRILDVGAAAGFFLQAAKQQGWETYGIEPSKFLSEYGNTHFGVNIRCGTLESLGDLGKPMDVITLWDVLEHTFEPQSVLKHCNRLLAEDGLVVVNYPNIGNWMARLAGRRYWFILSVHLYYFVPATLRKMLLAAGFEVVSDGPHFQWLDLGYLIYRFEAYFPNLGKFLGGVARMLGCQSLLIPYFAAQTRVLARKIRSV